MFPNKQHAEEIGGRCVSLFSVVRTLKFSAMPLRGQPNSGRIGQSNDYPRENYGKSRMLLRLRMKTTDKVFLGHFHDVSSVSL